MLRSLKDLETYTVNATDGDVGTVSNFLFDDEHWTVRYLIVETDRFFGRQQVLVSPTAFRQADWSTRRFHVALTREQIKGTPSVDADKPVSRQHEREFHRYYGYPQYWGWAGTAGLVGYPGSLAQSGWEERPAEGSDDSNDVHLRSAWEVRGYQIEGGDGPIGHVADFVVDDESWAIRYLVIDTRNWWFGKKVLIAPHWASRIDWDEKQVSVDLSRQAIKDSPTWDPSAGVNRQYESRLYDYYGRPVYWDDNLSAPPRRDSDNSPRLGSS
jgi:sporulation protein YlmC with PRC-barrel domain